MATPVRITESDLRAAIRDERYWNAAHPESTSLRQWVTEGYSALHPRDGQSRGSVWVRAYVRDGRTVMAHWRAAPPGQGGALHPAQSDGAFPRLNQPGVLRGAPDGRGSGGPTRAPGPVQRPVGETGDRVELLRRQSAPDGVVHQRAYQWQRSGGQAQLERDLQALTPTGPLTDVGRGVFRQPLADGRTATIRDSTVQGRLGPRTPEIQEPLPSGRAYPSDIFRYSE